MMKYQAINAQMTDAWCEAGWEWGQAITHEEYVKALNGEWNVRLTPTKYVPHACGLETYRGNRCSVWQAAADSRFPYSLH